MSNLSEVKGVELPLFSFLEGHDLDVECVGGVVASLDGIVQVPEGIVWVTASQVCCPVCHQAFDALVRLSNIILLVLLVYDNELIQF